MGNTLIRYFSSDIPIFDDSFRCELLKGGKDKKEMGTFRIL